MPVPNIYEDTGATHGTGALSVPWGTHNDTFCAVLVVTCAGGDTLGTPTQSGSDGTWTFIASCAEGTGAGSIQIGAWWCRATTGSMSNVDVPDAGDHTSAKMFMLQNVVSSGNPINMSSTQTVSSATTAISMAAPDTTVNNCLVFCLAGCAYDQTGDPGGSGWANSSLASVGFAGHYCSNNGTGGGYMGGVGSKTTAGTCGTFTHTWPGAATKQANIILAISDTATSTPNVGSASGTGTATGVGGSVSAAAGSASGTGTATGVGAEEGNVGAAAGSGSATGVGGSIAAAAGSASGTGTATASSVEHRLIEVTTTPQTFTTGNWSVGAFEAKWKVMLTMTNASGNAAYDSYHGVVTSGALSGFGLWLVDRNFEVYDTNDNQLLSIAATWSADQKITLIPDFVNGTLTISGATTGNGVHNFTPSAPHWESGSSLYVGKWGSGSTYDLAATIGSIYAVVTAGKADASGTSTPTAVGASVAAAAGSASGTGSATGVGEEAVLDFDLGVVTSARLLFGAPQTSVTTTGETTQASGSTFLICTGGLLTDIATAPTDNKSNTYTALGSAEEYADWPGYGIRMWKCVNGTGGSNHTFTQTQTAFEEVSIVVVEITDCEWIEDDAIIERADASSLASPDVTSLAEAHIVFFLSGDAPTGQTASITPNNGFAVIDDATGIDDPNGYVPIVAIHAYKATAGTYNTTSTISPTQGAIIAGAVLQRAQIAPGAGSASGTGTPTAVGSSVAAAAGSAAGTGSATAVAQTTGDGAASGTGSATGVGGSVAAAAGAASGAGTATGVGGSVAEAAGAASGAGTATGVGGSVAEAAGAASGTGSAAGVGGSVATANGAAAGTGSAAAAGASVSAATGAASGAGSVAGAGGEILDAVGAASGTGAATAVGASVAAAAGSASGAGSAAATGSSIATAVGETSGVGSATAAGSSVASADGAASGIGSVAAIGLSVSEAVGTTSGAGSAAAAGASVAAATGDASGTGSAIGVAPGVTAADGSAAGASTATAVGTAITDAAGAASGAGSVAAAGAAVSASAGTASGTGSVAAIGSGLAAASGGAAGTGSAVAEASSIAAAAGAASGATTPTAVGASIAAAAGAASGASTPTAVGTAISAAAGAASGSGTATAQGLGVTVGTGAASGGANVTAQGESTAAAAANATGTGAATAVGGAVSSAAGAAAGTSNVTGVGNDGGQGAGQAAGAANVQGAGSSIVAATGSAAGTSTVGAESSTAEADITVLVGVMRYSTVLKGVIPR